VTSVVELQGVRFSYGAVEILHAIDLAVTDGEFLVVLGPSGSGKTTILRLIGGFLAPSGGRITLDGKDIAHVPINRRPFNTVFQDYALFPHMTVLENVAYGLMIRKVPKAEREREAEEMLAMVALSGFGNRRPSQLSGGQRQRVAMGRALVRDPALFLFDEPLSNLDAKLRVEMRTEIKKLYQRLGKTTIYVTHDQVEAMTLASRIAVMHHGMLQQFAEPRTVYDRPANMFVASFMGSPPMNFLPAQIAVSGPAAVVLTESDGQTTRLPLPEEVATFGGGGRRVVLGIRPENLTRYDRRRAEETPYLGTIEARVEVVEPTGAETMVIVRIAGGEVIACFEPNAAPSVGQPVKLAVDMAQACLFDPETEMLI